MDPTLITSRRTLGAMTIFTSVRENIIPAPMTLARPDRRGQIRRLGTGRCSKSRVIVHEIGPALRERRLVWEHGRRAQTPQGWPAYSRFCRETICDWLYPH